MNQKARALLLSCRLEFNYHSSQITVFLKKTLLHSYETPGIDGSLNAASDFRRTAPLGKPHNLQLHSVVGAVQRSKVWHISSSLTNVFMWMSSQPLAQRLEAFVSIPLTIFTMNKGRFPLSFPTICACDSHQHFSRPSLGSGDALCLILDFFLTLVSFKKCCFSRLAFRIFDSSDLPKWRGVMGRH